MQVSEVKALAPLADVYELNPDTKYLIVVQKGQLCEHTTMDLLKGLKAAGVSASAILTEWKTELKIFGLEK